MAAQTQGARQRPGLVITALTCAFLTVGLTACGSSQSGEQSGDSAFEACVEDAANHLQAVIGLSTEQARRQAASSPRCSPLASSASASSAAAPTSEKVWPAGIDERTKGLIQVAVHNTCVDLRNRRSKDRTMEMLLPNFTPAQAEQVYAAALQKC